MNDLTKTTSDLPAYLAGYEGASGFENVGNEDIATSFLKLAQLNTPEAQPGSKAIDGLKGGDFFNQTTRRNYGQNPRVIMLAYFRRFLEWDGEGAAAKLVAQYTEAEYARLREAGKIKDGDAGKVYHGDNRVTDTRNFILLNADALDDGPFQYSASSTAISGARKWLSAAIGGKAPMWAGIWKLGSAFTEGDKGNYFKLTPPERVGWVSADDAPAIRAAFDQAQAAARSANADSEVPF